MRLYLPEGMTTISSLEYRAPKQLEISKAPPKGTTEVEFATNRSPVEVTAISAGGGVSAKLINILLAPAIARNWVKDQGYLILYVPLMDHKISVSAVPVFRSTHFMQNAVTFVSRTNTSPTSSSSAINVRTPSHSF